MDLELKLAEMRDFTEKMFEASRRGTHARAYFEGYIKAIDDALELTKPIKENTEASDE